MKAVAKQLYRLLTVLVVIGCGACDAQEQGPSVQEIHISAVNTHARTLPELTASVVLQISFFDREGSSTSRVRVHADGRIERAQDREPWAQSMALSPPALQELKDRLVSTGIAQIGGTHGLNPPPSDIRWHIIQAPQLAQGVTVVTDGKCACAALKRFYREVMPLLAPGGE